VRDVRLVLDTDAVVAAMRSPGGASAAIVRAVRGNRATLLLSVPLALEYEAVCRRPEHRMEAGLSIRQVEIFLDAIVAMGEPVETHFLWRPQLRDPTGQRHGRFWSIRRPACPTSEWRDPTEASQIGLLGSNPSEW